jgi:hypothetical protein
MSDREDENEPSEQDGPSPDRLTRVSKKNPTVTVTFEPGEIERLDTLARALSMPGVTVTRAQAVKHLVTLGWTRADEEIARRK